ncbi:hypothetical protein NK6_5476 [Bradyrhizobium diazoefficiens]|uniref:Uncharacterized protein n=1 Tax=Bradyrhizobium diazoefficiens TaxID=1355477 RepID=A0A0E4FZ80_9BRAD|nr:hypothetical protein NK6_5476 [Bradyrhizobium diazoefficiens]
MCAAGGPRGQPNLLDAGCDNPRAGREFLANAAVPVRSQAREVPKAPTPRR